MDVPFPSLNNTREPPGYRIDPSQNSIALIRKITEREWSEVVDVVRQQRITALDANGYMTDEALGRLVELSHLTSLMLGGSRKLTDTGIAQLSNMPQLRHLNLSEYPGGTLTDQGLRVLRHLPNLRTFEMTWQRGISDEGASNLRFCDQIESVSLMGTGTGDGVISALRGKQRLRRFETGKLVTNAGLSLLQDFPRFQTRNDLEESTRLLIDGPFTNEGLAGLMKLEGLADLDLFWHVTGITSDAFAMLKDLPNLTSLGCDGELSDNTAMLHIAAIPRLRKLRAQSSVATDEGFLALSRSKSLENFWGRECPNFASAGFIALSQMPSLRALGISCRQVSESALALLPRFPALRDLTSIGMSDEGFQHVGTCHALERLSCMYCRDTTDIATEYIGNLQLKSYYAGLTQITDRSLKILSRMPSLESVELYQTKFRTDAGIRYLASLPQLSELHLSGLPNVSFAGTELFPSRVHVKYNV